MRLDGIFYYICYYKANPKEIEYIFDMAPHQSSSLYSVKRTNTYTLDHKGDFFI